MYAIIRAGGKQYKVQAGDTVRVEKLEKRLGETFDLIEVLFVGGEKSFIGQPVLKNAKVTVTVTRQAKAPKIIVFKKKRRQGYRKMQGHRQLFTELFVNSITSPEGQTAGTEKSAVIIDPIKILERKQAAAAKAASEGPKQTKVAAKSVDRKKKTTKKAGGKKKTKKAGAKKAAKKKTTKKSK